MKQKKQSLVELAESLGFTRAADDDPIYTEGIFVVSTVAAELERLEREEASQKPPVPKGQLKAKQGTNVKVVKPKKGKS